MTAAVLSIGTELTRGELVNTNASWLAEELTQLGFEVTAMDTTDDDASRIRSALHRLGREHQVVVCTGGLGPTTDDITAACVAELLGVPLERDEASLAVIRERMARFGRVMAPSNQKQADFPEGAQVLPNRKGTAPGFWVQLGQARCFFMPGVPREMKSMFSELVAPQIAPLVSGHGFQLRSSTFGMTESAVNDRLEGVEEEFSVSLGYRAHFPEIEVKVLTRDDDPERARRRVEAATRVVRERLGDDVVYGTGEHTFAESTGRLLVERGLRLAVAESCTGGLVASLLTERSGSSAYFLGGVVSYANSAKAALLGVPTSLIEQHGAVSEPVARAMAEGVRKRLGADLGLALTGIAGPTGGSDEKPVGLVNYAVATQASTTARELRFPGSRRQVQQLAAYAGLALVRKLARALDEA